MLAFFPILFQGKLLLPTDLGDSMTLPFSQSYGQQQAQNAYVSDGLFQFYPYKLLLRDAWQHGRFAFWNPLNLCGYPAYAETMSTNFDVLNIVLLLFSMPFAFHLYLLLPLLIAGSGFYCFLTSYKVNIWIARIFATSYMLCGLFITHLLPHFLPGSMCWAPVVCLFLKRYFDRGGNGQILLAGAFLCLGFLGGNMQTAMFLAILVAIYSLTYWSKTGPIPFPMRIVAFGAALTIGVFLSAIMWLPTLELFGNVLRDGLVSSTSLTRGYSPLQRLLSIPMFLTFFIPSIAGSASGMSIYKSIGVFTIDFNAAIGYIPLLIGFWAAIKYWRDRTILPFALMVFCGFLFPIATPLFRFLYHRFFIVAIFGLCGAGAIGFQHVLDDDDARESARRLLRYSFYAFAVVAGLIVTVGLLILTNHERAWAMGVKYLLPRFEHISFAEGNHAWIVDYVRATIDSYSLDSPAMILSLLSIAIGYYLLHTLLRAPIRNHNMKLAGIWAVGAFQVGMFAYTWLPHVDSKSFPLLPRTHLTDLLSHDSSARVFVDRRSHPNEQYLLIDNENAAYGIAVISGFESLLPRSFYLHVPRLTSDSTMPGKLLGLLNVRYILTGNTSHLSSSAFELLDSGQWRLWKNRAPVRRVSFSDRVMTSPNDSTTLAMLDDTAFDPRVVAFTGERVESLASPPPTVTATAKVLDDKPESVTIETSNDHPGYLVLSDTYYPGWECFVDGHKREIHRANYAMRAVYLEAGKHRVAFVFDPMSYQIGKWISILSLAGVLGFGTLGLVRRSSFAKSE